MAIGTRSAGGTNGDGGTDRHGEKARENGTTGTWKSRPLRKPVRVAADGGRAADGDAKSRESASSTKASSKDCGCERYEMLNRLSAKLCGRERASRGKTEGRSELPPKYLIQIF